MSSKNSNKLPAWDLSDMYKGIDDPKIGADLEKFRKNAPVGNFSVQARGFTANCRCR